MLASFGVGQVLWSFLWFFIFVMWIMLLFEVFADVFRSKDMGGLAKALWILFVIVTPYLGVFIYLIVRGTKMGEHRIEAAQQQQAAMDAYIRDAAGGGASAADELARLGELKDKGLIDDAEFAALKAKIVS